MGFFDTFLSTIGILLPIANPPNAAAVFYSLTKNQTQKSNNIIAIKMAAYVTVVLALVLLGGNWIISLTGIPIYIIQIVGGSVLTYVGWKLIKNAKKNHQEVEVKKQKISLFPLTIPVVVGPGSIISTMAIAVNIRQHSTVIPIMNQVCVIVAIAVVAILIAICCIFSGDLIKKLGDFWSKIFVKVAALINIAFGIHIIWLGIDKVVR